MPEWFVPDGHPMQKEIAEAWGWRFFNQETYDDARTCLFARYPGCSGIAFYEDCLEETNTIFQFDTEEQMSWWLLKWT